MTVMAGYRLSTHINEFVNWLIYEIIDPDIFCFVDLFH